ncbi:TSL-kinase interacting protein 1 [Forsythia ovata]|uniref:TSL-kinase interacting protein 1 n=1 Tax=Forsythia ovata TaxID=205694 RepID=A0ABD1UT91_9LAMI
MRSTRQPKRKITEVCIKENESRSGSVKKSANGTGRGDQKSAECKPIIPDKNPGFLPCSAAPLSGQTMPSGSIFGTESGRIPPSEFQIHQEKLSAKVILQLFPLNENTRLALEKDGYNPFLELSLSAGKKISSVIKHLNSKWGSSSIAHGQLMLFPYNIKSEKIASCRRWTSNGCGVTAGEVYITLKSPSIFRLRYGWFSNIQMEMFGVAPKSSPIKVQRESESNKRSCSRVLEITNDQEENAKLTVEDIRDPINIIVVDSEVNELKSLDVPVDHVNDEATTHIGPIQSTVHWDDDLTNLSIGGLLSDISLQGKINNSVNKSGLHPIGLISEISIGGLLSEASLQGKIGNPDLKLDSESSLQPIVSASNDISVGGLLTEASLLSNKSKSGVQQTMEGDCAQLPSPWDDNLTTLSIGGLLSEASLQEKVNGCHLGLKGSKSSFQPNASLSDSFDAFIAAQLNTHSQALKPTSHESHSSILDAEETCHAFPVRELPSSSKDAITSNRGAGSQGFSIDTSSKPFRFPNIAEMNNQSVLAKDSSSQQLKTNPLSRSRGVYDEESSLGLSSIKWVTYGDNISISEIVR